MTVETPSGTNNYEQRDGEHKETPARFRLAIEAILKANFKDIDVKGEENLDELPPDAKVIIATTHISDYDVVIPIAKLGKRFRIKAVNASIQHDPSKDLFSNLGLRAIGKDNTIPVDYEWGEHPQAGKSYYALPFNPDNFVPMGKALEEGDAIVMAAYNPSPVKEGKLPDKGGYGAAYLADTADAWIVPVAIDVKSEDPNMGTRKNPLRSFIERPEVEMVIGKPFHVEKTGAAQKLSETLGRQKEERGGVARKDLEEFRKAKLALRNTSDRIMYSLADLLPEEKRGRWAESENNE